MEYLIGFAIIVVILVVPVMIGAKVVDARNRTFGYALLAVVIMTIVSMGVSAMIGNEILALVISTAIGAAVIAGVMGTTFLRGLAVSIIAAVIQFLIALLVFGAIMGAA